jgi:molybdenum cofactor cytidylyltransferase
MTGIIILAAGSSSRLGTAKQALVYQGQTLLQRAVHTALQTDCKNIAVVLGANADTLKTGMEHESITLLFNADWEEGMASSIRCGLAGLQKTTPITSVILMLCDQPYVDVVLLNRLLQNAAPNKIIASAYNNAVGPPALFDSAFFNQLLSLSGNEGAKKIMLQHPEALIEIPFPLGAIDIDTKADYDALAS